MVNETRNSSSTPIVPPLIAPADQPEEEKIPCNHNPATLELVDIYKSYNLALPAQTQVLHGLNLTLKRGEFVALIGHSGSGKSTLLNLIGLLDKPSSGELLITGVATTQLHDSQLTQFTMIWQFTNNSLIVARLV